MHDQIKETINLLDAIFNQNNDDALRAISRGANINVNLGFFKAGIERRCDSFVSTGELSVHIDRIKRLSDNHSDFNAFPSVFALLPLLNNIELLDHILTHHYTDISKVRTKLSRISPFRYFTLGKDFIKSLFSNDTSNDKRNLLRFLNKHEEKWDKYAWKEILLTLGESIPRDAELARQLILKATNSITGLTYSDEDIERLFSNTLLLQLPFELSNAVVHHTIDNKEGFSEDDNTMLWLVQTVSSNKDMAPLAYLENVTSDRIKCLTLRLVNDEESTFPFFEIPF